MIVVLLLVSVALVALVHYLCLKAAERTTTTKYVANHVLSFIVFLPNVMVTHIILTSIWDALK